MCGRAEPRAGDSGRRGAQRVGDSGHIASESRDRGINPAEQRVSGAGPFSSERCARWLTAVGPYGFFVGRGVGVGIGVRPTGGVANGFGLGDSDGFGVKPQMFQLKRP